MVSIHIVPVIVCLIIKVISSTFRFKRGELFMFILSSGLRIALVLDKQQPPTHLSYICIAYTYASIHMHINKNVSAIVTTFSTEIKVAKFDERR